MLRFGKSDLIYDAGDEASVRYSRSIVPKQPFRFRPASANSSRKAVGQQSAHVGHSARSPGFSKPDDFT
ncbi:MAG: hypothetical protein WAN05_31395 [Roseiarcus sp.]